MKINTHPLSQSCSLGTLLHRSNRCGTFVNLILICDCDGQRGTLAVNHFEPILFKGFCTSAYPVTSKSGFLQKANIV